MSTFNISGNDFGGPAAFGDGSHAVGVHHNGPDPATLADLIRAVADLRVLLDRDRAARRDPAVGADLTAIEAELVRPDPGGTVVRSRIASLADRVAPVGVIVDAVARMGELAARMWPQ